MPVTIEPSNLIIQTESVTPVEDEITGFKQDLRRSQYKVKKLKVRPIVENIAPPIEDTDQCATEDTD